MRPELMLAMVENCIPCLTPMAMLVMGLSCKPFIGVKTMLLKPLSCTPLKACATLARVASMKPSARPRAAPKNVPY